ncbi:YadA family autotransporter adhesin [Candidatus Burkholderia verschuerenii]|uniref:YadA family autotransporter adhesin n=1 Tax=Candidatus Burkholderia verschuerenii TaxID=242163 RepID=UPI001E36C74A|nr:YadA-like family protein [Candidatus Burkholderia verschuerenii]
MSTTLSSGINGKGIKYFHANSTEAGSSATGKNSIAIGPNASATAENSVAIGNGAMADQANTVSFGGNRITNIADGVNNSDVATIGQLKNSGLYDGNTDTVKTAVTYDTKPDGTTDYSSITLGNGNATTIHNVAAGTAATDLANKSQLDALANSIKNITVEANPMFAADGNGATEAAVASGPHATASGANAQALSMNSVANGANAVARGNYAAAIGANSSATADSSVALCASSVSDRANKVSVGSAGNERQITNVAAGTADTDLVNVNQLNEATANAQANSYTDSQVNALQSQVSGVARSAYSGIAAASAMAMIPNIDQDKTFSVGVGGATYQGYAAAGLSLNIRVTQNLVMKAGAAKSNGGTVYGANASYRW